MEDQPLKPLEDFPYAVDKARSEEAIAQFSGASPQVGVTIFRSCVVMGPTPGNRAASSLFRRVLLGVWREDPPWQFIHEDDLASALTLAVINPKPGIYNVAGSGVVPYSEVARTMGARLLKLSPSLVTRVTSQPTLVGNSESRKRPQPAAWTSPRHPLVMSTGRVRKEMGFHPRYSSREALADFISGTMG